MFRSKYRIAAHGAIYTIVEWSSWEEKYIFEIDAQIHASIQIESINCARYIENKFTHKYLTRGTPYEA